MKYLNEYNKFGVSRIMSREEESEFMNDSINGILIEMIDDGFIIKSEIEAIPNRVTNISIRNGNRYNHNHNGRYNPIRIKDYKDTFEMLNDFLKEYKYDFFHISLNGKWVCDDRDRAIQFTRMTFDEIWKILNEGDPEFRSIIFSITKK